MEKVVDTVTFIWRFEEMSVLAFLVISAYKEYLRQ